MADTDIEKSFTMHKIYVKDFSFEAPRSPEIFSADVKWKPKLTINVGWETNKISETSFESVLKATVTADLEDKTVYLVEIEQAGLFGIEGYNDEEMEHLLNSFCPQVLYPFVREAIADVVGKGGFPRMLLKPMQFDALYAQHKAQAKTKESQPDEESQLDEESAQ